MFFKYDIKRKRFDNDDKRLHKLLDMIRECFKIVDISGGIINQIPFLRYIAPSASGYNQIMSMLTNMWTFLGETIDDHKLSMQYTPRDLIDSFLQHTEKKTDESFTDQQLLSMCLDLFMAGAETTSNSLSFAFMYMILYPDVQKKVQQELDKKIGRDRWPTVEDKNNLKYTQAVLMEIQRRCNLAPMGVTHRTTKTTSLYGYTIPENAVILLNLYSIHMNLDYWKDPMKFKPERFLDESGNITVDENYYLPFGLGKRRCLGEGLAKTQIFLFFTCLLHNFTFEAVDGFYPCEEPYDGFALAPKPFKAKLIPRYT
ncbi:methyl farnesoate epoxidase-like [Sitophilus oryzae]|uniref:Methyl farnesoate epoxidase-like n=1 Tax=Sitophilus oryzae TaxID=7048 RepID=A0A6J2YMC0_SITOR|nr:methyl farnesoate epoxidase-like [Sitophilus oryzae]